MFRILMMLLIVLHHEIVHTSLAEWEPSRPLYLLSTVGVDGFLAISGWFGMRFSAKKFITIAGQIIFYGVLFSLWSWVVLGERRLSMGDAWYGVAYLALLGVVPVLNACIETVQKSRNLLWGVLIAALLFGDWISRNVGLGFSVSGFGPHTFATFVCVYCLVRFVRSYLESLSTRAIVVTMIGVILLYEGISLFFSLDDGWCFYNSPFVVSVAVLAMSLFYRMKLPHWLSVVATCLAPSMFAVYLIHDANSIGMLNFIIKPVSHLQSISSNAVVRIVGLFLWAVAVMLIGVAIDVLIRRCPLAVLAKFRSRKGGAR